MAEPGYVFSADAPVQDPLVGSALGEYEVVRRIGSGGMGIVYEAVQPLILKRAAIKVVRAEIARDRVAVERLIREARAVNAIRHRNIIDIFGFGEVPDGRHYFVMELLEGESLRQHVKKQKLRLPLSESCAIVDEILTALSAAHEAGVIHRDLKPSNVFLVTQRDGLRYLKLLDFGLAKIEDAASHRLTAGGHIVGTPRYMSPEQIRGETVGPATDLYALGVMFYELVTGRGLFHEYSSVPDLLNAHLAKLPPAPRSIDPTVEPEVEELVLALLEKRPEDRPRSASEVKKMLAGLKVSDRERPVREISRDVSRTAPIDETTEKSLAFTLTSAAIIERPGRRWLIAAAFAAAAFAAASIAMFSKDEPAVEAIQPIIIALPEPEPPVVEAEPAKEEVVVEMTRPPPKPRAKIVPRVDLMQRINKLERALASESAGGSREIAKALLEKAKLDAAAAKTPAQRRSVETYLDEWEAKFDR